MNEMRIIIITLVLVVGFQVEGQSTDDQANARRAEIDEFVANETLTWINNDAVTWQTALFNNSRYNVWLKSDHNDAVLAVLSGLLREFVRENLVIGMSESDARVAKEKFTNNLMTSIFNNTEFLTFINQSTTDIITEYVKLASSELA